MIFHGCEDPQRQKLGRLLQVRYQGAPDSPWQKSGAPSKGVYTEIILTWQKKLGKNCDECHVTKLVKSDKESVIMALCKRYSQGAQICVSAPARGYRSQWQVAATHTPPGGLGWRSSGLTCCIICTQMIFSELRTPTIEFWRFVFRLDQRTWFFFSQQFRIVFILTVFQSHVET